MSGQGPADSSGGGPAPPPPGGDQAEAADAPGLFETVLSFFDSLGAYVSEAIRLEGLRIDAVARGLLAHALLLIMAAAVGLIGILFICLGAAMWIGRHFGSPGLGLGIVGLACVIAAGAAILISRGGRGARRKERPGEP